MSVRAKRPKTLKLIDNPVLRAVVEAKLVEFWSPEQISGWLRVEHPDDESMWVSHGAIYLALYAKQLVVRPRQRLRTLRRRRRHRRKNQGQGRIRNPIIISERPAHVEKRVEFGHWEGDLIIGNRSTALATLVERASRYTILVPLPGARQWFPRSTDFHLLDRQVIAGVQSSLNDRPRQTLGFRTPADVLATACRNERAPSITTANEPRLRLPIPLGSGKAMAPSMHCGYRFDGWLRSASVGGCGPV